MYLSQEIRNIIWENGSSGTIIFHPPKAAGISLDGFYGKKLNNGFINLEILSYWDDKSEFTEIFRNRISLFKEAVASGSNWAIKFPHSKLTILDMQDIPAECNLLMPYRGLYERFESLVKFYYRYYLYISEAKLTVNRSASEVASFKMYPPQWNSLNTFSFFDAPDGSAHFHRNLLPEEVLMYATDIPHAVDRAHNLELGNFDFLLSNLDANFFFYSNILGDLLDNSSTGTQEFERLNFVDVKDLDQFIFNNYGEKLPKLNSSVGMVYPNALLAKLKNENFKTEFMSTHLKEKFIEERIKENLWSSN
jgi:hypothetical protein